MNLNKFHADLLNLKRLNGLSLSSKARYLTKALIGEILRVRIFGTFGLRLVEISLTDRCQCRCVHCYAAERLKSSKKSELTTDELILLIKDIKKLGATEIVFTGGEPLLREDILKLINYAHEIGLISRLITNGILLDDALVGDLKKAGLNWCSISIDSPKPNAHDEFRRYPGCFDKAMNGFRLLSKYKIPSSIISVARKNLISSGELEEIVALGKKIGVTVVRINFPVPIGRFYDHQDQVLSLEEREHVRKLLGTGIVSMESPREGTKCTAAVTKLNIHTNGDVTPCVFVPLPFGNIRTQKLTEIWQAMDNYIQEYKISGQCPMCDPFLRKKLFDSATEHKHAQNSAGIHTN